MLKTMVKIVKMSVNVSEMSVNLSVTYPTDRH